MIKKSEFEKALAEALVLLSVAKVNFAPNTTNSDADVFINKWMKYFKEKERKMAKRQKRLEKKLVLKEELVLTDWEHNSPDGYER